MLRDPHASSIRVLRRIPPLIPPLLGNVYHRFSVTRRSSNMAWNVPCFILLSNQDLFGRFYGRSAYDIPSPRSHDSVIHSLVWRNRHSRNLRQNKQSLLPLYEVLYEYALYFPRFLLFEPSKLRSIGREE